MNYINDFHEMCDTLSKELAEANDKVRAAGGKLNGSDLEYIDRLSHALKSIKTTIAMMEAEPGESGMYPHWNYNRGSYARRPMGRYPSRGYSGTGDMISELKDLMRDAPDERTKHEFERFIERVESL